MSTFARLPATLWQGTPQFIFRLNYRKGQNKMTVGADVLYGVTMRQENRGVSQGKMVLKPDVIDTAVQMTGSLVKKVGGRISGII